MRWEYASHPLLTIYLTLVLYKWSLVAILPSLAMANEETLKKRKRKNLDSKPRQLQESKGKKSEKIVVALLLLV